MTYPQDDANATDIFAAALRDLAGAPHRSDLHLERIDAPAHLAPEAVAYAVEVDTRSPFVYSRASARFVLLHNPEPPEAWGSSLRVITFVKAPLELDLGLDPFVAGVVWSWLDDALVTHGARHHSIAGTVTKTINAGFGALSTQSDGTEIELRASWSAETGASLAPHLQAWLDVVAEAASLPPVPDGVAVFGPAVGGLSWQTRTASGSTPDREGGR